MSDIFEISTHGNAEDDGRAWDWSAPCPSCERSGSTQVRDVSATLVSAPAPVLGTDAASVLIRSDVVAAALGVGLSIPHRTALVLDGGGQPAGDYVQLVATAVLTVRSATYEPCGCVSEIEWDPLVVSLPSSPADTFTLDAHPNIVLVGGSLARFLQQVDPGIGLVPVQVAL